MSGVLAHLDALDRALVARGFPALSAWWRETLTGFYASGRRQLVLRVGRRGGKSSSLCRVAVVEAIYGVHRIPPGDVGIVGIVSISRDEAAQRLRTIKAILDALGIAYRERGESLELQARPIVFKTFAASVGGVVGGTWICAICDEVGRWKDLESGANPAREVLASLRPTLATMPHAKLFLSSSPLGTQDAHATAFARGDDGFQCVAHAPTWLANPTLTEADTRELEPDERLHAREYGAIPSDGENALFSRDVIDACLVHTLDGRTLLGDRPVGAFDGSMGRLDSATWAVARWTRPLADEEPEHLWMTRTARGLVREDRVRPDDVVLHRRAVPARDDSGALVPNPRAGWQPPAELAVWGFGALTGKFAASTSFDGMVRAACATLKRHGAREAIGDTYMSFALEPEFRKHGVKYIAQSWDHTSKSRAVLRLRQMFRDRRIAIVEEGPETDALRSELLAFREKVLPSGALSYGARSGAHDDRVALLLNLAMADTEETIKGSPIRTSRARHEIRPAWEQQDD